MSIVYSKTVRLEDHPEAAIFAHTSETVSIEFCKHGRFFAANLQVEPSYARALAAALIEAADAVEVKESAVDFAQVEVE